NTGAGKAKAMRVAPAQNTTPPTDLVSEILRRLAERTGEAPIDTRVRIWRAPCPVPSSEPLPAFVVRYGADQPKPRADLFCERHRDHSTETLLEALGLNLDMLTRGPVRGGPTWR